MQAYTSMPYPDRNVYTNNLTLQNTAGSADVDVAKVAYVGQADESNSRKLLLATARHGGIELVVSSSDFNNLLAGTRCDDASELQGRFPLTAYFSDDGIKGLAANAHVSLWTGVLFDKYGWDTCVRMEKDNPGKWKPCW